jgi:hypothetical protein
VVDLVDLDVTDDDVRFQMTRFGFSPAAPAR